MIYPFYFFSEICELEEQNYNCCFNLKNIAMSGIPIAKSGPKQSLNQIATATGWNFINSLVKI